MATTHHYPGLYPSSERALCCDMLDHYYGLKKIILYSTLCCTGFGLGEAGDLPTTAVYSQDEVFKENASVK